MAVCRGDYSVSEAGNKQPDLSDFDIFSNLILSIHVSRFIPIHVPHKINPTTRALSACPPIVP